MSETYDQEVEMPKVAASFTVKLAVKKETQGTIVFAETDETVASEAGGAIKTLYVSKHAAAHLLNGAQEIVVTVEEA